MRRSRRSRGTGWGSLLLAAAVFPLSVGWLVYSYRAVAVDCQRAAEAVTCTAVERVGGWEAWSATVEDIRIARGMLNNNNGGRKGVIAETQAGALVPLTSNVLGEDQIRTIASRIHAWIFTEPDSDRLSFVQPPSLANAALGAGIALLAALWGAASAVGVAARLMRRSAATKAQEAAPPVRVEKI